MTSYRIDEIQRIRHELSTARHDLDVAIERRTKLTRELDLVGRIIWEADERIFQALRRLYELGFYDRDPQAKP